MVTEIPFMVNKSRLIEQIAQLVRDKKITDIRDLRDESDRDGMRIVIELKRDAIPYIVLNRLYKHTQMQSTFGTIMLALHDGVPRVMPLREMLRHFHRPPSRGGGAAEPVRPRSGASSASTSSRG